MNSIAETFPPNRSLFSEPYLMLSNSDGCYRVLLRDIIYCTSYNSSTEFRTTHARRIVTANSIAYYEKLLTPYGFMRIHQSVLLNSAFVCHISKGDQAGTITLTTSEKLNMARSKKPEIVRLLKTASIEQHGTLPDSVKNQSNGVEIIPNSQKVSRKRKE